MLRGRRWERARKAECEKVSGRLGSKQERAWKGKPVDLNSRCEVTLPKTSEGPDSAEAELSQVRRSVPSSQMKPGGCDLGLKRREQICFFLPDLRPGPFASRPPRMPSTATSTPDSRTVTGARAHTHTQLAARGPRRRTYLRGRWALGGSSRRKARRVRAFVRVLSRPARSRPRPGGECPSGHVSGGEVLGSEEVCLAARSPSRV